MRANFYWSGDSDSVAKGFPILWIVRGRNNVSGDLHRVLQRTDPLRAVHDGSGLKHEDFGDCLSSPSNSEGLLHLLGALDDLVEFSLELING